MSSSVAVPSAPLSKVCIVGASGKLGRYMIQQCLDQGLEVVGVCRPESVGKLADLADRITILPGKTNDREVIRRAVAGCQGVLTVLAPWGFQDYSSGTASAVLDHAEPGASLVFSCGWHITRDGQDRYPFWWSVKVALFIAVGWLTRLADISDQVRACNLIFNSDTRWTVVRGSDLEEGRSQGLPVWRRHVGDPALASNLTRRVDYARFMVHALTEPSLARECPAIVGRETASARSSLTPAAA